MKSYLKEKIHIYQSRKFARKSAKILKRTMKGMGQEARETKEMYHSFFKLLECKLNIHERKTPPTEEEIKAAWDQLIDVGRFSFFAGISIIPGGGFSLIGIEILARKLGIKSFTFVPSAFRPKRNIHFKDVKQDVKP